ncbi:MAG: bifunctional 3-(3-hydroxy-phenyl)propionate/3-hydroxycinnamic acid hydroxylase [Azospirillaceae bacterium]|nr:bifunctional 3-(3-hydroxy-phenyl)propionate/3-hydroxycinnamic acid hydroxylase [Azospirillaceae bacterium]
MMTDHFDVAIIGCGPVGAALANLLVRQSRRVLVLDAFALPYSLPRATHLDGEAVRILQAAGISDMLASRLGVYPRMRFEDAGGALLIDWPRSILPGPQGWRDSNRFHQPDLEVALRARAAASPLITLRLGYSATAMTQDDRAVTIEATGPDGASRFTANFVVGCDGARSTVRQMLGAGLEVLAPPEQWLVADLILHDGAPALPEGTVQYCDPARPFTYIEAVGRRRRWEVKLLPGDDPVIFVEPDHVRSLLRRWLAPGDAEIERAVVYTFSSAIATPWRKDRVMVAGDAAHQTPPFLGQGLCAGLRDAANLAWKLAWVLDGRGAASLLDSYEAELRPHVAQYIAEANRIGAIIQETNPDRARARDAMLLAQPQILTPIRPRLGGTGGLDDDRLAGTLAPQPRLRDGRWLDDAAGPRFVILSRAGLIDQVKEETRARWKRADAAVLEGEATAYLDSIEAEAVIIRPDHYILGTARSAAALDAVTRTIPLAADGDG